ncbi:MAG: YbgA family protein [Parahaliea sp.]
MPSISSLTDSAPRPVVGIGTCLSGRSVRYNADSKPAGPGVRQLQRLFDTRPFCPEMGVGMGVPRPPIHLVGEGGDRVRALDVASHSHDHTDALAAYADRVLAQTPELCGYILVKGSPSCGYHQVKRYNSAGELVATDTRGIFATALAARDPLLPLEDDERLAEPARLESFAARVYAYHDWRQLCASGLSAAALSGFYSHYKYLVMAHSMTSYRSLGPMLAAADRQDIDTLGAAFFGKLMRALGEHATPGTHANVLYHLAGYLKQRLTADERQQLANCIDHYRGGLCTLMEPVAQLRQHFTRYPHPYIERQVYLRLHRGPVAGPGALIDD